MDNEQELNRHERRRQRTREKLQQAAMGLILEKGYDAMSIQDITDRADLGRGTFYIHFAGKEEIIWSVIQAGFDAEDRAARLALGRVLPPQPEFYAYTRIFRHAHQNRNLYLVMLGSQGSSTLTSRVQDYLAADFEKEMKEWSIYTEFDAPPLIVAQVITGALVRLIIWWLENDNDYTPEQMAVMLYETLHHQKAPDIPI